MKLITDPFGSLKIFAALLTLFIASRLADLVSTYFFLQGGGPEGNLAAAIIIEEIGFLGSAGLNVGIAILLLLPSIIFLVFRPLRSSVGEIRARRGSIGLFLAASIFFFVVALWNSGIFYSSENPLADFVWPLVVVAFFLMSWVVVRIAISLPVTTQART